MRKALFTLLLGLAAGFLQAKTVTVTVSSNSFSPSTVTVNEGDIVKWVNSSGTHNVTSGTNCNNDGKFASSVMSSSGDTFVHKFTDAGSYHYFCTYHCSMGMTGTVIVNRVSGIEQAALVATELVNFPNPFQENTTIQVKATKPLKANLSIFGADGRLINEMKNIQLNAGTNTFPLELSSSPAGIYIARISAEGIVPQDRILVKR